MTVLTSLYVGTRLVCRRPEPRLQRDDQRRSVSYVCQLCGDVWAREVHPLAPSAWHAEHSVCPRHAHYAAGSFLYISVRLEWHFDQDFTRFPKELLLYELALPCHTYA